tara:strand:- start:70 stop:234 length:165 start_codon:yes stop_codon:yes gene_type:complete
MTFFYLHGILIVMILIADIRGTLEPSVEAFEKKIGIYTEPMKEENNNEEEARRK